MQQANKTQRLINQVNALIEQINEDQERTDGFFRAENLSQEKIIAFANTIMNDQIESEAMALVQQDIDDIEKEIMKYGEQL